MHKWICPEPLCPNPRQREPDVGVGFWQHWQGEEQIWHLPGCTQPTGPGEWCAHVDLRRGDHQSEMALRPGRHGEFHHGRAFLYEHRLGLSRGDDEHDSRADDYYDHDARAVVCFSKLPAGEPLVEGSGCKLLEVAEGTEYDLGENGQETAGRHACLKKLRNVSEADTLVHSLGRCELWHCSTLARVRMSSGPGGGLSESPYAVTFKTANGHYITAEEDGAMKAEEETFVPEALFLLMPAENGKFVLKAQNDRFVKAEPSGHLAAVTEAWDDWEEFELVKHDSGKVSLRSFHNKYVSEGSGGSVAADAASATMLELANRSRHDGFENLQFHKTVSDEVSHSVCARPAEQAAVRCCSSDGSVASEDQYGCHDRKNYSEAEAICKAQSLELCTEVQAKSCPGCSTCGFETKQVWTSTACEGTEGLTQRRLSQRNDHAAVVSRFCGYQPGKGGLHGEEVRSTVFVKLMEWNYNDIAKECVEYLAPNGFDAVQVAPVTEHVLGYQWWVKYQPVSAGLDTRSGTEAEFRAMVATCRSVGVQVIVDILMNHMASPCKAARKLKKKANWSEEEDMPCVGWGGSRYGNRLQKGARGWDAANPKHFHHKKEDRLHVLNSSNWRLVSMWSCGLTAEAWQTVSIDCMCRGVTPR
ncbi:amy [Symbiodinium necroappetens]|uniref:Alpha-amylase n=1 Tax=Symbiodinium necroappetens TaxID=1628268 RepID=A0A812NFH7_9DINO|nr:amy [Symbiodinium necroappetens]